MEITGGGRGAALRGESEMKDHLVFRRTRNKVWRINEEEEVRVSEEESESIGCSAEARVRGVGGAGGRGEGIDRE